MSTQAESVHQIGMDPVLDEMLAEQIPVTLKSYLEQVHPDKLSPSWETLTPEEQSVVPQSLWPEGLID